MPTPSSSDHDLTPLSPDAVAQLAADLDEEAYRVTQRAGTERAFCGVFHDHHQDGRYDCIVCALPLFTSNAKFDSGTGWPSFFEPFHRDHVSERDDHSHGMRRVEVRCVRCGAHLGHVFPDGPPPTGARYCLNSAALRFVADDVQ